MPFSLNVYALPEYATFEELAGGVAVMIDVLRASTTLVHALESGASEIIPCRDVDEARRRHAEDRRSGALLAGERNAVPPEGFDLGNSPEDFTPESVKGRRIIFTTTNGTKALGVCTAARRVFIGAFVNAAALVEAVADFEQVHLVCAGTVGQITREDVLAAGLFVDRLVRRGDKPYQLNAQAVTAREGWLHALPAPCTADPTGAVIRPLADLLQETAGGLRVQAAGRSPDIDAASRLDRFSCVPEFLADGSRIAEKR